MGCDLVKFVKWVVICWVIVIIFLCFMIWVVEKGFSSKILGSKVYGLKYFGPIRCMPNFMMNKEVHFIMNSLTHVLSLAFLVVLVFSEMMLLLICRTMLPFIWIE